LLIAALLIEAPPAVDERGHLVALLGGVARSSSLREVVARADQASIVW
jgi:hypothetical protein